MLRILSKTASSTARIGGSATSGWCDDVDLSTWELVSASQSDDEDLYSFDGDDVTSDGDEDGDDVIVAEGVEPEPELDPIRSNHVLLTPCDAWVLVRQARLWRAALLHLAGAKSVSIIAERPRPSHSSTLQYSRVLIDFF
ncbi:1-(5-phosphoribosyl)-5-[(5-phosphoribosylamino) methylideneamino] imidazole-4-carboxamide isomerase [Striga asiatica]|uniref:1-(5-phosphoribosyl)-5-[(5-phosphoribosylamino) methylideneamino] imidazole-4-carboxamide isomerase n=1 Tax=Striga asiatica TaxID=4170 RepID=A0A5A7R1S1_STRAF|nr:1-(5-phosphoribosyl)-5-[(5-phosphoribosylamino) methylideneamino] imidazole-4-carboxamide isomerase [Striga asiatica]